MVSRKECDQLLEIADALFLREQQKISGIVQEESRLRTNLANLDRLSHTSTSLLDHRYRMEVVGADVVWQGWLSRTRRAQNIELARVMARKLAMIDKVRIAFGRVQALQIIAKGLQTDRSSSEPRGY